MTEQAVPNARVKAVIEHIRKKTGRQINGLRLVGETERHYPCTLRTEYNYTFSEKSEVKPGPSESNTVPVSDQAQLEQECRAERLRLESEADQTLGPDSHPSAYTLVAGSRRFSFTRECSKCAGKGRLACGDCASKGRVDCPDCHGGKTVVCPDCQGGMALPCHACSGRGNTTCRNCGGSTTVWHSLEGRRVRCMQCINGEVRCTRCAGAGSLACTRCHQGRVLCLRCEGQGDVGCPACGASGVVRCANCEGQRVLTKTGCVDCEDRGTTTLSFPADVPGSIRTVIREKLSTDVVMSEGDFGAGRWSTGGTRRQFSVTLEGSLPAIDFQIALGDKVYEFTAWGHSGRIFDFLTLVEDLGQEQARAIAAAVSAGWPQPIKAAIADYCSTREQRTVVREGLSYGPNHGGRFTVRAMKAGTSDKSLEYETCSTVIAGLKIVMGGLARQHGVRAGLFMGAAAALAYWVTPDAYRAWAAAAASAVPAWWAHGTYVKAMAQAVGKIVGSAEAGKEIAFAGRQYRTLPTLDRVLICMVAGFGLLAYGAAHWHSLPSAESRNSGSAGLYRPQTPQPSMGAAAADAREQMILRIQQLRQQADKALDAYYAHRNANNRHQKEQTLRQLDRLIGEYKARYPMDARVVQASQFPQKYAKDLP